LRDRAGFETSPVIADRLCELAERNFPNSPQHRFEEPDEDTAALIRALALAILMASNSKADASTA